MTLQTSGPGAAASAKTAYRIAELSPWFHNLHLPDGSQTAPDHPLGDFPAVKWRQVAPHLPADLAGWTVLDVGCNAGFYSIELARRGARVTAVDHDPHYLDQARWAAGRWNVADRIELQRADVYDLARVDGPLGDRRFDLVLFLGVLYHLRYPLLGLDAVAGRVGRLLLFQTLSMLESEVAPQVEDLDLVDRSALEAPGWPRTAFVEHRLAGDPTNWWVPNRAACEAMLRSAGLRVAAWPAKETYLCVPGDEAWRRQEVERHLDAVLRSQPPECRRSGERHPHGEPLADR